MPKRPPTYGDAVKARVKRLFEALLAYVNNEFEDGDKLGIVISQKSEHQIIIRTKLRILEELTDKDSYQGKLTKEQVREALQRLESFLGILEDLREHERGSEDWHFKLTLWHKDKQANLTKFEEEWENRRPLKSKATAPKTSPPTDKPAVAHPPTTYENLGHKGLNREQFKGREKDLAKLHELLQSNSQVAITAAVTGMGGVGKSELAIQYAKEHLSTYPGGVCWLPANSFAEHLWEFAHPRFFPKMTFESFSEKEKIAYCWQHWAKGEVLLVFDDMDMAHYQKDVQSYLPASSRFKVLITTRERLGKSIAVLDLEVLEPDAALDFLKSLVGERVEGELQAAGELCAWLGYLPLGLELVGRYLEVEPLSISEMLRRLQQKRLKHPALIKEKNEMMTAQLGVEDAFDLSWKWLDENAQELGCLLSLFALAPIPWSLVEQVAQHWRGEALDMEDLEKSRRDLVKLHLPKMERSPQTPLKKGGLEETPIFTGELNVLFVSQRSLIREFFQDKLQHPVYQDGIAKEMNRAFAAAMAVEAQEIPDTPNREKSQSINRAMPHIAKVAKVMHEELSDDEFCWIFQGLAKSYNGQGVYNQVASCCQEGLSAIQNRFGIAKETEPSDVLKLSTGIKETIVTLWLFQGKVLRIMGQYKLALDKYRQSLVILQDSQENVMLVRAWRGQGHVYRLLGEQENSIKSYEESLRLAKAIKYETGEARAAYGVARIYRLRGNLEKAKDRYQEASTAFERLELPVEEAWAIFGLGEVQRMQWELESSRDMYSAALEEFKQLGHKEGEAYAAWGIGDTSRLLGGVQAQKGNTETAKSYFETAKENYKHSEKLCQQVGDRRSEGWALLGLAEVSRMEGKYQASSQEEAITKYKDALSKYQQVRSQFSGQECVEEAHALLGIASTQRLLMFLVGATEVANSEITKAYTDTLEIYQSQNRNMNYCLVAVLIDRALYYLKFDWKQSESDLNQAERICLDNNYTEEKRLIEKIKIERDNSELHTLNFP